MTSTQTLYGNEKPIYYVMAEGGRAPSFQHRSRHSASIEAKRLCALSPGTKYHIVKLKETVIHTASGVPKPERRQRELDMFDKLNIGDEVEVIAGHYAHAGKRGVVSRKGAGTIEDTSVYVILPLFEGIREVRISPASLTLVETTTRSDEPKANETPPEEPFGPLDALLSAAMGALVRSALGVEPEAAPIRDPQVDAAQRRLSAYKRGDDVLILARPPMLMGFIPGEVYRAKWACFDDDNALFCHVDVLVEDETQRLKVNVTRVFKEDDPMLKNIAGEIRNPS